MASTVPLGGFAQQGLELGEELPIWFRSTEYLNAVLSAVGYKFRRILN